jgi:hypothetical protein
MRIAKDPDTPKFDGHAISATHRIIFSYNKQISTHITFLQLNMQYSIFLLKKSKRTPNSLGGKKHLAPILQSQSKLKLQTITANTT